MQSVFFPNGFEIDVIDHYDVTLKTITIDTSDNKNDRGCCITNEQQCHLLTITLWTSTAGSQFQVTTKLILSKLIGEQNIKLSSILITFNVH